MNIDRRGFVGGLIAAAALPSIGEDRPDLFPRRGRYERLFLNYVRLEIGVKQPFSVLHISDTHLTAAYPYESEAKRLQSADRTRTFGGRQEEALRDSLAWAKANADYVIHTGDLIDWQSEANFDLVRRYFGANMTGSMGNHEFSPTMGRDGIRERHSEDFKARSREILSKAYPFDISFQSTVVNGVNFITLDDVYGYVVESQVRRFREEVKKGLPIVLCMHVPIPSKRIQSVSKKYWMGGTWNVPAMKFRNPPCPDPVVKDPLTREFFDYLRREPLLKAILCGHEHFTFQDDFSPTARQYIVGGNFMFAGQEVLFC